MERIERELINEIRRRSKSYTPEWRFSEEEPDMGSALAIGFCHGFAGTEKRFGRVREKNRAAFADATGAQVLPAEGAEGYAAFSLSGSDVPGSMIPQGTELFADDAQGEQVRCETAEDVFVVAAECESIFQTVDERDEILRICDSAKSLQQGFLAFSFGKENLQSHAMLFSEDKVLNIISHGDLVLSFSDSLDKPIAKEWMNRLADLSLCRWEYGTAEGYVPIEDVDVEDGRLVLRKTASMPASAPLIEGEWEGMWLRLRLLSAKEFFPFSFSQIRLFGKGEQIYPELLIGGGIECPHTQFLPFGERLDPYSDVYFGSDEVLGKSGANVRLVFRVDFRRQPFGERNGTTRWEWIMRKEDFVTDEHTDVSIDEVIWEYYNGRGWTSLVSHEKNRKAFTLETVGGKMVELRFRCPEDMSPVLVSSQEIRFIRARIIRISNLYKPEGSYILPVVSEPFFEYEYTGKGISPSRMILANNLTRVSFAAKEINSGEACHPFEQTHTKGAGLYFLFSYPPVGSPIRVLIEMAAEQVDVERSISWEYLTDKGWRNLRPVDETKGLTRTGILSFGCYEDMKWERLFGREGYWIRAYTDTVPDQPVFVRRFCINATKIISRSRVMQEDFSAWQLEADRQISLSLSNVAEVAVYVDEQGYLTGEEEAKLLEEGLLVQEKDDLGLVRQSWVQWQPVEDFSGSGSLDRHYLLFATEGIICFGDGRHGKIPTAG
ncbi:MAG: hypothetical protein IJ679_12665, partial [Lachnospiraceae bacterium]|nr:hypothetical protein [Lachnospiraceae bacterium]